MTPRPIEFPERPECPFCTVVAAGGELVASNELAAAFFDNYPLNPGHLLVVPRRHTPDLFDLSELERKSIFDLVAEAKEVLVCEHGIEADGWNLGVNVGLAAGQTIGHLHVHLIPRYTGDVDYDGSGKRDPRGGVRWILPERAAYWD